MSLQGTIDTFEIPDVLRLLSATKKTGHLSIVGNRGHGTVWVKEGDIVASEASAAPWASSNAEVVFELLRYSNGDFAFQADDNVPEVPAGKKAEKVDPVLNSANSMLKEWEEIEKVVPSLASPLRLAPKLPEVSVEINEASWKMIVGIGSGTTVGELGNMLEQSEIVVSRNVKQLVESKLVDIEHADPVLPSGSPVFLPDASSPSVAYPTTGGPFAPPATPVESAAPVVEEAVETVVEDEVFEAEVVEPVEVAYAPEHASGHEEVVTVEDESAQSSGFMFGEQQGTPYDYSTGSPSVEVGTDEEIDLDDPAQVARAIEHMDPIVTRSVTQAARAESTEERDAILADLQHRVSPLDFAVIQRFVYSLTT